MVRTACFDKNGKRKGAWSAEEDNKLRDYIQRYGHWNWRELPKYAGLSRCGKSCRLRWMNYLKPDVKRGSYTKEEDDIIINLYAKLGSKWSLIAAKLPGRTDNDIKNHWHTHLKKRTKQGRPVLEDQSTIVSDQSSSSHREQSVEVEWASESTPQSGPSSSSDAQEPSQPSSSEPSNCSELSPTCLSGMKWAAEDSISSLESFAEPIGMNFWTEPFLADTCYYQFDFSSSSSLVDSDFMFPEFSTYDAPIGLQEF